MIQLCDVLTCENAMIKCLQACTLGNGSTDSSLKASLQNVFPCDTPGGLRHVFEKSIQKALKKKL